MTVESMLADPMTVAASHWDQMSIEATKGGLVVAALATVIDKRPNHFYVWTLSVKDATGEEVWGRNYDDQAFERPTKQVTFREAVPLNPGEYTVNFQLWNARPDLDYTAIRRTRGKYPLISLSKERTVHVRE